MESNTYFAVFRVWSPSAELTLANLSDSEKYRIHNLLRKLQPPSDDDILEEPYPFVIFLFRQIGLLLRTMTPHIQSFLLRLMELEKQHNVAKGMLEMGMGMAERGVNIAIRLGLNDALLNFSTALGRGLGETYKAYKGQ
jgi:hypothetical protein